MTVYWAFRQKKLLALANKLLRAQRDRARDRERILERERIRKGETAPLATDGSEPVITAKEMQKVRPALGR